MGSAARDSMSRKIGAHDRGDEQIAADLDAGPLGRLLVRQAQEQER